MPNSRKSNMVLSPREQQVMILASRGKKRIEIAATLNLSDDSIKIFLKSVRTKLKAENTTHAVAISISRGLITP